MWYYIKNHYWWVVQNKWQKNAGVGLILSKTFCSGLQLYGELREYHPSACLATIQRPPRRACFTYLSLQQQTQVTSQAKKKQCTQQENNPLQYTQKHRILDRVVFFYNFDIFFSFIPNELKGATIGLFSEHFFYLWIGLGIDLKQNLKLGKNHGVRKYVYE